MPHSIARPSGWPSGPCNCAGAPRVARRRRGLGVSRGGDRCQTDSIPRATLWSQNASFESTRTAGSVVSQCALQSMGWLVTLDTDSCVGPDILTF